MLFVAMVMSFDGPLTGGYEGHIQHHPAKLHSMEAEGLGISNHVVRTVERFELWDCAIRGTS